MPQYIEMKPNFRECDTCGDHADRLYLVPYKNKALKNSDLCLCVRCFLKKGYVTEDIKIVYFYRTD